MTNTKTVYDYMKEFGSITSREAFKVLYIRNLRGCIFDLKASGVKIVSKWCNDKTSGKSYKKYKIASRFKLFDKIRGYK